MEKRIVWSESAYNDLLDIYDYISRDRNPWPRIKILQQAITRLGAAPLSGRGVAELPGSEYKEIDVGNHKVIFRQEGGDVLILAIVQSRRDVTHL
ncbi:MAG: type II toxin-antitoxin system RelE/ParE family toxin [Candidatus Kapaibacterium sp.]